MTVLSPLPKSTVISVGTPRNACMTRRWSLSVTGDILEQLTDRGRPVDVVLPQEIGKTSGQIWRQIIQRFEQRPKKLLRAWTVHEDLQFSKSESGKTQEYEQQRSDVKSRSGGLRPRGPPTPPLAGPNAPLRAGGRARGAPKALTCAHC